MNRKVFKNTLYVDSFILQKQILLYLNIYYIYTKIKNNSQEILHILNMMQECYTHHFQFHRLTLSTKEMGKGN